MGLLVYPVPDYSGYVDWDSIDSFTITAAETPFIMPSSNYGGLDSAWVLTEVFLDLSSASFNGDPSLIDGLIELTFGIPSDPEFFVRRNDLPCKLGVKY